MSSKKGKGGKSKRKGKKNNGDDKRELEFKDEDQEYAQVTKMLGDSRIQAMCADGVSRTCLIRGKMVKRVWINVGDIILLGLRDFDDDKADVIHKYSPDEARMLQAYDELPASMTVGSVIKEDAGEGDGSLNFVTYSDDEADEAQTAKQASDDEEKRDWNKVLEEL